MTEDKKMDRREFFKRGFGEVAKAGTEYIDHKVTEHAKKWVRPPFAKPELDFLLDCNRCGDCVVACPHQVIFPLPIRLGASVAATPAMDILNKGCHLCTDWPCVLVCDTNALVFPELNENEDYPEARDCPPFATAVINETHCIPYSGPECGACRDSCPITDTLLWHDEKPFINPENCVGCGLCREVCITSPKSIDIKALQNSNLGSLENV